MANGPQLKTVPLSDLRCIHTFRQDQLLCSTPIVSSCAEGHFGLSRQQEVPLISSRSTEDLQVYWNLMMSLNYLTGQIMAKKLAMQCRNCLLAHEISPITAMESRLYMIKHNSLPVLLVFYRKENVKLLISKAEWRMQIGLDVFWKEDWWIQVELESTWGLGSAFSKSEWLVFIKSAVLAKIREVLSGISNNWVKNYFWPKSSLTIVLHKTCQLKILFPITRAPSYNLAGCMVTVIAIHVVQKRAWWPPFFIAIC